jgi:hypothetical protein
VDKKRREPLSGGTASKVALYAGGILVLAVMLVVFDHARSSVSGPEFMGVKPLRLVFEVARELSLAALLGFFAAITFELVHLKHVVGDPLNTIIDRIEATRLRSEEATERITQQSALLESAANVGIRQIHHGASESFRSTVVRSVQMCDGTLQIVGRTHAKMLGSGSGFDGPWLLTALTAHLSRNPTSRVHILLGDAFSKRSPFRESAGRRSDANAIPIGRDTVVSLVEAIFQVSDQLRIDSTDIMQRCQIRLTKADPTFAAVITPSVAFMESYLQYSKGRVCPVLEVAPTPRRQDGTVGAVTLYSKCQDDFERQFANAVAWQDAMTEFVQRKRIELGKQTAEERDQAEVERVASFESLASRVGAHVPATPARSDRPVPVASTAEPGLSANSIHREHPSSGGRAAGSDSATA